MKYVLTLLLLLISQATDAQITLNFKNAPILEALQTIEQGQHEYSIAILSDGLSDFHTSAKINNLSTIEAVKLICKDLPLRIKTKGKTVYVQAKIDTSHGNREKEIERSGNVEDGFLEMPLPHAKVSICRVDRSVIVDSAAMFTAYNHDLRPLFSKYTAKLTTDAKELLIHARLKGYNDVWKLVSIGKRQTEVEVSPIRMRKTMEIELREVVVKATRIKMFYRGDTIVYDATAFKLPQGSMLDDLIRQMPGVTMNDAGEIFVNGRKIDELMLGSRSFFKGNRKVMLENLPYYVVKEIKVYERQTDKSMALGYDVEPKQYVMDVNLKEEYQRGYIANVEAAAGSNELWLARAFGLMFTDRYRFTLLGNLNNVNETRHI